ncbi:hypothetical protein RYA05_02055 [Pseudomonas syringae pv. actinidiae]|nr:hypothetical protein [Pseudomonas syringae pv. actinidiae]
MITRQGLQQKLDEHMLNKDSQGQAWDHLYAFNLRMAIAVMKHRNVDSTHAIGGFIKEGAILPSAGQRIIIPKGMVVNSMRPGHDTDSYKTNREVVVHSITIPGARGFHEEYSDEPSSIQELAIEIKWAGKGSYWNYVTLNDWIEAGGEALTQKLAIKKRRTAA